MSERTIRGCCSGAGHLLATLGIDTCGGHDIEATFQAYRSEVEIGRGETDYVKLAAIHLDQLGNSTTLFGQASIFETAEMPEAAA